MDSSKIRSITMKMFMVYQASVFTTAPFSTYLIVLVAQVAGDEVKQALLPAPILTLLSGTIGPYLVVSRGVQWALGENAALSQPERISRILKLPIALELGILSCYFLGVNSYGLWFVLAMNKPWYIIPWGTIVFMVMIALVMLWTRIYIERLLMPTALEFFAKDPHAAIEGGGVLWPKQRWYLPYTFALFVMCTLLTTGTVAVRLMLTKYSDMMQLLDASGQQILKTNFDQYLESVRIPLASLGLFMLISAAVSAVLLARHQHNGFRAIQQSIEGFVGGNPKPPMWLTTDELGDLARVTARAFDKLRQFSLSLRDTAASLGASAGTLDQSNLAQNEAISRQAAALQETQVTAQEIRQTSLVAAQKAESVLQQTNAVEMLGREGEQAIEQSIESLQQIRTQVADMASRIKMLGERARQIESITRTVKDLADQSNMLALNAAIEAVRSGEHGKGFGVVAREIRSLADQSIRATGRVREILQELSQAIRSTVEITDQGSERVKSSVEQVRAFGDNMRKLSAIMQDNILSVRQISAAVSQQNQGITQIFQAINDINTIMNDTMVRLNNSSIVTTDVRAVAEQVTQLIANYGWESSKSSLPQGGSQDSVSR